jgi:hypothetical protein
MALSRANLLLPLLACPAVVVLAVSLEDVNASECLASAAAVRQEYPGAWPSWTLQAAAHRGVKCWFPATRENRSHRIEAAPRRYAVARARIPPDARDNAADDGASAPADEMSELGWSFHSRTARIGATTLRDDDPDADSSFDDRFAAVFERNSLSRPSTLQYMMVVSGNLP